MGNKFLIGGLLDEGGIGKVYAGINTTTNEPVVIKAIISNARRAELLRIEARNSYWLAYGPDVHPNVARFLGAHEGTDGRTYLVYEFVPGKNLDFFLFEEGKLSPGEALKIAGQVCEALIYYRDQGIVHCDVKPLNIIFDRSRGKATLVDTGLAVASQDAGNPGTMYYAAPEQLKGERVNETADVFALAVTLRDLLAGDQEMRNHRGQLAEGLLPAEIPDDIARLLFDMINIDPAARPTLDEVKARITELQQTYHA